uniref:LuxR family two-component transcriptional regulator n=2 Tax=Hapalosiphonaceae TaxID=1892263 RepID=A0A075X7G5_9CYAN|nr:LuxR family two-component transcriptional regulator [Hapalosiphon welwitschii UH IC-52-3]AIH14789.1 LuxR family two-component transcriptional regulator [Westiella intricata UH HT-29-1]
MDKNIRVLLADEPSLIGVGIRATLSVEKNLIIVGEANSSHKISKLHQKLQPDLIIMDLDLPQFKFPDAIAFLHRNCSKLKILGLMSHNKLTLSSLKINGIAGCVLKSEEPQTLINASLTVAQGKTWFSKNLVEDYVQSNKGEWNQAENANLTQREQQILRMIARGLDNACIANELSLGHQTVRNYISQIYAKLGLSSRTEAVLWAIKNDVLQHNHDVLSRMQFNSHSCQKLASK